MELLTRLPAFLLAIVALSAVPGPAFALIVRRSSVGGFRAGVSVVLGVELGLYFWIIAAGAGLAALVATSHVAYLVLRVTCASFLLWVGARFLLAARRHDPEPEVYVPGRTARGGFAMGALTNLANPKAAVFTFAIYPQFIPHGYAPLPTTALLGLLQITVETALYLGLAAAAARAGRWFSRRRVRRTIDAVCGSVLVGLGLRVATEGT
jgi:threonine/homoserine/homoserine lactone efflux protein